MDQGRAVKRFYSLQEAVNFVTGENDPLSIDDSLEPNVITQPSCDPIIPQDQPCNLDQVCDENDDFTKIQQRG